jgi:hypothetical protein
LLRLAKVGFVIGACTSSCVSLACIFLSYVVAILVMYHDLGSN